MHCQNVEFCVHNRGEAAVCMDIAQFWAVFDDQQVHGFVAAMCMSIAQIAPQCSYVITFHDVNKLCGRCPMINQYYGKIGG